MEIGIINNDANQIESTIKLSLWWGKWDKWTDIRKGVIKKKGHAIQVVIGHVLHGVKLK